MNDFYDQPRKSSTSFWIWLLVIVILAALGYGGWWWYKNKYKKSDTANTTEATTTKIPENWTKGEKLLMSDVTSTSTVKLADGTYRMFYMKNGRIVYADSKDTLAFDAAISTGVSEDSSKMISNPAVLKLKDGTWIMIYEQQPLKAAGSSSKKTPPGPETQRDLYLAASADGKSFTKVSVIIDSSKEDNYFASVPDLVCTPDGSIRIYYVSGGNGIGSAKSTDNGKTWKREAGYRLADSAVDPEVMLKTENGNASWVMYFSQLIPSGNAIFKATSTDGLTWEKGEAVIKPSSDQNTVIDPDIVELSAGKYRMFFAETDGDSTQSNPAINLYYADSSGEIF